VPPRMRNIVEAGNPQEIASMRQQAFQYALGRLALEGRLNYIPQVLGTSDPS